MKSVAQSLREVYDQNPLTDAALHEFVTHALRDLGLRDRRVTVVVPDATRTAPMRALFPAIAAALRSAARVDVVIALGTHPPMSADAIDAMLGMAGEERSALFPNVHVHNHRWDDPMTIMPAGIIEASEASRLTDGVIAHDVPVRINRLVQQADHVILCGPVFPHEVAGFSGGAKYLFPGVAGPEIIDFTHWLGALATSMATIGVIDTPVRRVIHRAAEYVNPPVSCLTLALSGSDVFGAWFGEHQDAFEAAAAMSATLNIVWVDRPYLRVLSIPAKRYQDMWTAAKAIYKTEPVVADGGEIVVYAPWLRETSITHGELIDRVGYHVRDYFTAQPERFGDVPGRILAHSTHVKGSGTFDPATDIETPRVRVVFATGISQARTTRLGLSYLDPDLIDQDAWERAGCLVVHDAGEKLYRIRDGAHR